MTKISATEFVNTWKEFINDRLIDTNWTTFWKSNTNWSDFILGGKSSSQENSPIGRFFKERYANLGFRTEDGSIDLSFFDQTSSFEFKTLDKDWELINLPKEGYPSHYVALIEHENDIYSTFHEIAKLTYYRAQLKVLVTYHSKDNLESAKRSNELKMLTDSFEQVLKKSALSFPENRDVEYLLIVGGLINGELKWTFQIFDHSGQTKN